MDQLFGLQHRRTDPMIEKGRNPAFPTLNAEYQ